MRRSVDVPDPRLRVDAGMQPAPARATPAGSPLDEYKHLGDDLRHYGILRLYRLTLLLGTTGALVSALASEAVRERSPMLAVLKAGGLVIALAFTVMDYRSGAQWQRLQNRSNALAESLGFQTRPTSHPWNPLTTTGAGRALHLFVVCAWLFVLILPLLQR